MQVSVELWPNEVCDNTYEGVSVRALLNSGATGLFMSKRLAEKQDFKLEKLARPIKVRNVDVSNNKGGLVIHEMEVNMYYKEHVE